MLTALAIIPLIGSHLLVVAFYLNASQRQKIATNHSIFAGAITQTLTLIFHFYPETQLGLGINISLFMLITIVIAWHNIKFIATRRLILGLCALSVFAPLLLPPVANTPAPTLHGLLAIMVYVCIALTTLHWFDLRMAEKQLIQEKEHTVLAHIPPLLTAENHCFRYIKITFVLLTLTILSGGVSTFLNDDDAFKLTHKNIFAGLTWLIFGILLVGRHFRGWRGKKAWGWFFIGYLFLLLSYLGSTFVWQVILKR